MDFWPSSEICLELMTLSLMLDESKREELPRNVDRQGARGRPVSLMQRGNLICLRVQAAGYVLQLHESKAAKSASRNRHADSPDTTARLHATCNRGTQTYSFAFANVLVENPLPAGAKQGQRRGDSFSSEHLGAIRTFRARTISCRTMLAPRRRMRVDESLSDRIPILGMQTQCYFSCERIPVLMLQQGWPPAFC